MVEIDTSYSEATIMKKKHPFTSVVLVNWNGKQFLKPCLDSVLNQTCKNYKVILVDNASKDKSLEFVKKKYGPQIKNGKLIIIANRKNYGSAEGINIGIHHAFKNPRVKYIATLNVDTIAERDWLEKLMKATEDGENVGMIQGKILHMDKKTIDSTGLLFYKSATWFDRGENERDSHQYDEAKNIFGVCAAAALYSRKMLEELRPEGEFFDRDFFGYCEDVDLSIRARLLNWHATYAPDAVVYHHRGGTTGPESDFQIYHFQRNNLWLIFKTLPSIFIVKNFWSILISQLGGIFISMIKKRPIPVIIAKLDALRMSKRIIAKRKTILKTAKTSLSQLTEKTVFPAQLTKKYLLVRHR